MSHSTLFTSRLPRIVLNVAIILGVAYALQRIQPTASPPLSTLSPAATTSNEGNAESAKEDPTITFMIEGLTQSSGVVRIAIFSDPANFPDRSTADHAESAPAAQGVDGTLAIRVSRALCDLGDADRIAIAAYHDINDDGILNKNPFGIPSEPYGFSNGARGSFGPPSFEQAAIEVSDTAKIELK